MYTQHPILTEKHRIVDVCRFIKKRKTEISHGHINTPPWPRPKSYPRMSGTILQTYTCLEWATRPSPSSLVRSWQQLVWLFSNGINTKYLSISLGLGLHARSHLVECQWSWERWGISPELHGRILSVISRQLWPYSPIQQSVTHNTVDNWNLAAHTRSPYSRKHMYRPFWSLPMEIWIIQRRTGGMCCDQMRFIFKKPCKHTVYICLLHEHGQHW